MKTLRMGILGAARIAPAALIAPAREIDGVDVVAIAARDVHKAQKFAAKHGVGTVYDSYAGLLANPDVDAIYNPLPNGLHGEWTLRALAAGKHVLCEKPFTANAEEARQVADAAHAAGLVVMEAFHWRYHPLAARMREIIDSGEIGELQHVSMSMCFPLPMFKDIRWQWPLAGGSMMDAGCYAVSVTRFLANAEPKVTLARSKTRDPEIDRHTQAELLFDNGITGSIEASMWSRKLVSLNAIATGSDGVLSVQNPILPQLWHSVRVKGRNGKRKEKVAGDATYTCQLRAFRDAVAGEDTNLTDPEYSVRNMAVVDAVYRVAGLALREPAAFFRKAEGE